MKKSDILTNLRKLKVVAVVRGNNEEEGYQISSSCIDGGIQCIEVAYTNNKASQIIERLNKDYPNSMIGAGTVLDSETARMAILAGAKYVVSPSFNKETAIICNRYAIPYIPGCMTIKEVVEAMEAGCEMIKMFPGGTLGQKFISSILSPLPQVSIMVTGGVNLNNAKEWFDAGAEAIGIGGEFNKLGAQGKFEEIKQMAKEYIDIVGE